MTSPHRSSLRHREGRETALPVSPAVRLALLGGFRLELGRRREEVPPRVQQLLAFLALHDGPLRRAYVAGRLWLDASQEQAFGSLRTTLWRTHRVPAPLIEATSTHVAVARAVVIDARELEASAQRILHHRAPLGADDVERVAGADELLPDWYEEWVLEERGRLGELRLLALEAACEELTAAGRQREATTAALAAVAAEPLRESARSLLISTYLAAGNRAEAARQFADYRRKLERELGLEPSPRILELMRAFGSLRPWREASTSRSSASSARPPST